MAGDPSKRALQQLASFGQPASSNIVGESTRSGLIRAAGNAPTKGQHGRTQSDSAVAPPAFTDVTHVTPSVEDIMGKMEAFSQDALKPLTPRSAVRDPSMAQSGDSLASFSPFEEQGASAAVVMAAAAAAAVVGVGVGVGAALENNTDNRSPELTMASQPPSSSLSSLSSGTRSSILTPEQLRTRSATAAVVSYALSKSIDGSSDNVIPNPQSVGNGSTRGGVLHPSLPVLPPMPVPVVYIDSPRPTIAAAAAGGTNASSSAAANGGSNNSDKMGDQHHSGEHKSTPPSQVVGVPAVNPIVRNEGDRYRNLETLMKDMKTNYDRVFLDNALLNSSLSMLQAEVASMNDLITKMSARLATQDEVITQLRAASQNSSNNNNNNNNNNNRPNNNNNSNDSKRGHERGSDNKINRPSDPPLPQVSSNSNHQGSWSTWTNPNTSSSGSAQRPRNNRSGQNDNKQQPQQQHRYNDSRDRHNNRSNNSSNNRNGRRQPFNGKCWNCLSNGHRKRDCPIPEPRCKKCRKRGHMRRLCPKLQPQPESGVVQQGTSPIPAANGAATAAATATPATSSESKEIAATPAVASAPTATATATAAPLSSGTIHPSRKANFRQQPTAAAAPPVPVPVPTSVPATAPAQTATSSSRVEPAAAATDSQSSYVASTPLA
jgi:hypothetical protein